MSLKFRKSQRLKSPADFKQVYDNKQWGNTKLFSFNVLSTTGDSKLGVTVSKKVSKLAVRRNQIKRVIKEFYRIHQHELTNASLIITAKATARASSNEQLNSDLEELWKKVLKWQRWNYHQQQRERDKSD